MGTQHFQDGTISDAESIIKYTRKPKTPPPYVPRSRSLNDLPGGIRVPIIKKQESRLQQKHEANAAGLEELKMLRQKQGQMVHEIRTTYNLPETTQRRCSTNRLSSSSSLAIIKEETICRSETTEMDDTKDIFYQPKARFSIASDDSRCSRCSSDRLSGTHSSNDSLNASLERSEEQLEPDSRTREQILEEFQRNFQQVCDKPNLPPRRRASVQVESFAGRAPPPVDRSIRPKLRRASFQCEAVLTKTFDREDSVSKTISDFKLQYNFPSPLHAVTRQYGSSSDIRLKEKSEPPPKDDPKDLKSILSEWNNDKLTQKCHKSETHAVTGKTFKTVSGDSHNQTGLARHSRNHSSTSDYFGSTETMNTVNTCPIPSSKSADILERRRQSLPISLSTDDQENAPKIPMRRLSFLDKSKNTNSSSKSASCQILRHHSFTSIDNERDDGIIPDEELPSQNSTNNKFSENLQIKQESIPKDNDNVLHESVSKPKEKRPSQTTSENPEKENDKKLKQNNKKEPNNNIPRMTLETAV